MLKNVVFAILAVLFLSQITGCIPILAGAACGAGTASWLSEKEVQEVDASFDKTIRASESALKSLGLDIKKEIIKKDVAQIKSTYNDGKTVWIDIHKISSSRSKVSVRVGASSNDEAERKILNAINKYL